jgi:hypothetical protein
LSEVRTVYNWKGQGGVQEHCAIDGVTLCGKTPTEPNWSTFERATADSLANVSCLRCRQKMGTDVAGSDAQTQAAAQFLRTHG